MEDFKQKIYKVFDKEGIKLKLVYKFCFPPLLVT